MAGRWDQAKRVATQREYEFTLVAQDPRNRGIEGADDVAEKLLAAGCDDATVSFQHGVFIVDFARPARNLGHALASAIADVRSAGLHALRIEPDEIVSAAEIARRFDVSRQAVHKWFRSHDDRPAPVHAASTDTPLYDWTEVVAWLRRHRVERASRPLAVEGRMVKMFNESLASRNRSRHRRTQFEDPTASKDRGEEIQDAARP